MNRKELNEYGKSPILARKIDLVKCIVEKAITKNENWYIAFSGGKDSTVMLDIIQKCCLNAPAVWVDDEWWLPETMEYMRRMVACGLDLHQVQAQVKHARFFTAHGESNIRSGRDYTYDKGWAGAFIGIRADESNKRRVMLRTYGTLYYAQVNQQWQCYPLAWWSVYDVWAYIFSRGLDYNHGYDVLGRIGVPIEHRRIGPLAVDSVLQYGQLAILKKGWPELYERFCEAHPVARLWV